MIKRYYTIDDAFELDWLEVTGKPFKKHGSFFYYKIVRTRDDEAVYYDFPNRWIYSDENPSGVWFDSVQDLAVRLVEVAEELNKIDVTKI